MKIFCYSRWLWDRVKQCSQVGYMALLSPCSALRMPCARTVMSSSSRHASTPRPCCTAPRLAFSYTPPSSPSLTRLTSSSAPSSLYARTRSHNGRRGKQLWPLLFPTLQAPLHPTACTTTSASPASPPSAPQPNRESLTCAAATVQPPATATTCVARPPLAVPSRAATATSFPCPR